jgi:recombination protein RecR
MNHLSPLVDQLILALQCLPGVGPKSARRLALYILERGRDGGKILSESIISALNHIGRCKRCRFFTETEICSICSSLKRDKSLICVVETATDLLAIEETGQFKGGYFVLHGYLSPLDGMGPKELGLDDLVTLVEDSKINEIILAINSTLEGEATSHYIYNSMKHIGDLTLSSLARGLPLSSEIEYLDGGTLMLALQGRNKLDYIN